MIQRIFGSPAITGCVKAQGVRWREHVCRMPEYRHAWKVLVEGSGEKKKKRWLDTIMTDVSGSVRVEKQSERQRQMESYCE